MAAATFGGASQTVLRPTTCTMGEIKFRVLILAGREPTIAIEERVL